MKKYDFQTDDIDKAIIRELQKNGRISYKIIAKKLNVSDSTIRSRVNRMVRTKFLRITALVDPLFHNESINAYIGIHLIKRTNLKTMEELENITGVVSVTVTSGEYDLFVEVLLPSRDALSKFLLKDIAEIENIGATDTFINLTATKKWVEYRY